MTMVHLAANAKEYSQNLEVFFIITLEMFHKGNMPHAATFRRSMASI